MHADLGRNPRGYETAAVGSFSDATGNFPTQSVKIMHMSRRSIGKFVKFLLGYDVVVLLEPWHRACAPNLYPVLVLGE